MSTTRDYKENEEIVKRAINDLVIKESKRSGQTTSPSSLLADKHRTLCLLLNKSVVKSLTDELDMTIRIENFITYIKENFFGHNKKQDAQALLQNLSDFIAEIQPPLSLWQKGVLSEIKLEKPKPTRKMPRKSSVKPNSEPPFRWWGAAIGFLLPIIGLALCFAYPPAGVSITLGNLFGIGPVSALLGASVGAFVDNYCCLFSLPPPRPAKRNGARGGSAHPTHTAMAASTAGKQEPQPEMKPDKSQPLLQTGGGAPSAELGLDPADKAAGRQPRVG